MPKLCQIIAVANGRKSATQKEVTAVYQMFQKHDLLSGLSRTYTPLDAEEGETLPPESKKVQLTVHQGIERATKAWKSMFEVVATQDWANCSAKADVKVGDNVLMTQVPVTHLLFLEKQLADIHAFITKMPTLDPAKDWNYDSNKGFFKTAAVEQNRTTKIQQPVTLAEATKEHPAQVELVSKDVLVGKWATVHFSGAVPADEKRDMLERVLQVQEAVKYAREQANQMDAEKVEIGEEVLSYIFG